MSYRTSGSSRDSAAETCLGDHAEAEGKEENMSKQFTVLDPDEEAIEIVLVCSFPFQLAIYLFLSFHVAWQPRPNTPHYIPGAGDRLLGCKDWLEDPT